jgi:hypothetical protein
MNSHLRFRPDLDDATLEDRVLLASGVPSFLYPTSAPMILSTSGFVLITTPSVIASSTGTGVLSLGLGVYGGTSQGLGGASAFSVTALGLAFYAASVSAANLLNPSGSGGPNNLNAGLVGSGASADGGAGGGRTQVTNAVVGGSPNGQSVFTFIGQESGSGMPAPTTGQTANGNASGTNASPNGSGQTNPPPQIGAPPRMNPTSESGLPTIPNAVPTLPRGPGG